jgi:riboflavin kinase/FMN adenylyltransferase
MIIKFPKIGELIDKEDKCVIIGDFDGIHIGHQKLYSELSKEDNYKKLVITFKNSNKNIKSYLTPFDFKCEYISKNYPKIDYIYALEYNNDLINMSYLDFINFLKINGVKKIICNNDFRFGKNRLGNVEILKEYFIVNVIDTVKINDKVVSSTSIRNYLNEGDILNANLSLNRLYSLTGRVIEGKKIGRKINFPTINVDYTNFYLPKNGVYEVLVGYNDNKYLGMCNVGVNPTVTDTNNIKLEIHIFDFEEDMYDKYVDIYFVDFIRCEKKFNSIEDLRNELSNNKQQILDKNKK